MADYQLALYDPFGTQLAILDSFATLTYVRTVNQVGSLVLTLPPMFNQFLFSGNDIRVDNKIAVNRSISGGQFSFDMDTIWFVRRGKKILTEGGEQLATIICVDAIELLKRRIIAYAAGSAEADKSDFADDFIKAIVRENLGSLATDTDRNLSSHLSIDADVGQGATIAKAFSRRNVMDVCQEVAAASDDAGTYVAFDVVATSPSQLAFRTFIGQRGVDHRYPSGQSPILIGPEYGNLTGVSREYDHLEEASYIYAAGQGEGSSRAVGTASDANRIALSPFNRIEKFADARLTADATRLADEAGGALRKHEPRSLFSARLVDTPATIYGLHYGFGDYVTANFEGENIYARIEQIRVTIRGGEERIDTRLRVDY